MSRRGRKTGPVINDWHLWSEVTRSVSPLRPAEVVNVASAPSSQKPPPGPFKTWSPTPTPQHIQAKKTAPRRAEPQTPAGRLIEPRIRRRLMRGQLPIDATIDLHGLRQAEAHAALCRFVAARHRRGDRTLLVITGKGLKKVGYGAIEQRGVLRTMLPIWLSEPALNPMVAGWETSAQSHGGEGAYYVRLKRAER